MSRAYLWNMFVRMQTPKTLHAMTYRTGRDRLTHTHLISGTVGVKHPHASCDAATTVVHVRHSAWAAPNAAKLPTVKKSAATEGRGEQGSAWNNCALQSRGL